jgi:hypothetical protein
MTSDIKKAKADTTPKNDAVKVKNTAAADVSKAEGSETTAAAPSNYSRGEGQKPVTRAYKENWNTIFAKNNAKKTAKKKKR